MSLVRRTSLGRRPARSLAAARFVLGVVASSQALACVALTEPSSDTEIAAEPVKAERAPAPNRVEAQRDARGLSANAKKEEGEDERIGASHILVKFKGASRADDSVTRSKEEAQKLAAELQQRAAKTEDFSTMAKKYSEDKGSGQRGGSLGKFGRRQMVKPFADAAFALKPGEVSQVVESPFGFHIIKRDP